MLKFKMLKIELFCQYFFFSLEIQYFFVLKNSFWGSFHTHFTAVGRGR